MLLFVLIFLAVYGGLNAYIYYSVVSGLGHHSWPVASALIFLVFSPILLRLSERRVPRFVSATIAWVGYNWMGVGFLFASIALLFDIAQIFLTGLTQNEALLAVCGLTLATSIYGFWETRNVRVRVFKVQSPKLEYPESEPFRIVQISDLHLGYGTLPGQVASVVDKINSQHPDLVVSTGDLFDTDLENLGCPVEQLKTIAAPHGKLAITGNHEVYGGLKQALALTEQSGFQVLRSASVRISAGLYVAGVDDPEALDGKSKVEAEEKALMAIPEEAFTLLLKHRPNVSSSTLGKFDLQLSGHTHGGQIFPFIFMTRLQYKARHGLTKLAETSYLYLSRGTGTWGPQIRVFAPPEITVFELSHGEEFSIAERP